MNVQPEPKPQSFGEVWKEEWSEIQSRRMSRDSHDAHSDGERCNVENNPDLVGLALSGGGIRSATFSLGFLQGLNDFGLLKIFDLLSTVSGGGYVGAWWSAWLSRDSSPADAIFPARERNEMLRSREDYLRGENLSTESSISAGKDPIHHLRLFSNYLTPRRGLLSSDTWRVGTFILRNLVLTWLALIPVLVAIILLGQLFFVLPMNDSPGATAGGSNAKIITQFPHSLSEAPIQERAAFLHSPSDRAQLKVRLQLMLKPMLPLVLLLVYCIGLWIVLNQNGPLWLTLLTVEIFIIVVFLTLSALSLFRHIGQQFLIAFALSLVIFPLGIAILWALTFVGRASLEDEVDSQTSAQWQKEVFRNKLGRLQMWLLALLISIVSVLAITGFAPEVIDYVCCADHDGTRFQAFWGYVTKSISLSMVFGAIAGLIYTWSSSLPTGASEYRGQDVSSPTSRLIFAITPHLVLVVLIATVAWLAHALLRSIIITHKSNLGAFDLLTVIGMALCFVLAIVEIEWEKLPARLVKLIMLATPLFILGTGYGSTQTYGWSRSIIVLSFSLIAFKLMLRNKGMQAALKRKDGRYTLSLVTLLLFAAVCGAGITMFLQALIRSSATPVNAGMIRYASAGLASCVVFDLLIVAEQLRGGHENRLPHMIVVAISLVVSVFLLMGFSQDSIPLHVVLVLMTTALVWVIALGWMVDPNGLSLHSFYRARLVRAYLGASNSIRQRQAKEITEAAAGDDVLLAHLKNSEKGAPYHLINSTLNLVGARDLATAQRSSAMFTLSKLHCGSLRTGYRPTKEYMDGQLSLGTAVAISGAAVSPNMGAVKVSTPLTMLLTLLNARLGFWAPTPNQSRWRSAQVRLWPYYIFREFLSETNDLSSYCYLTDGGHFDNTGIYSLIQRGCRFIVLADCGADPGPCFQDLGDAIRRSRIDFGVEFDLDITPLLESTKGKVKENYIAGTITYSSEHVETLEWTDRSEAARTGYIILCKPSLTEHETADVRQYAIENLAFPHQTTADQWYDEAQFESYRKLGYSCAQSTFTDKKDFDQGSHQLNTEHLLSSRTIKDLFLNALQRGKAPN